MVIQQGVLSSQDQPTSLASAQKALTKHEAFAASLFVHHSRVEEINNSGKTLIANVSSLTLGMRKLTKHSTSIKTHL